MDLARVSFVDENLQVVYDSYVKPWAPVRDYVTRYVNYWQPIKEKHIYMNQVSQGNSMFLNNFF